MSTSTSSVTGTVEDRCHRIIIDKPKGGVPTVLFQEQKLVTIGDTRIEQPGSGVYVEYKGEKTFEILDATTGQPTGKTAQYADLFQLIKSAYIAAAAERDAETAARIAAAAATKATA